MGAPGTRFTRADRMERDKVIVKLKKQGLTYDAIAKQTGLTSGGVGTAVRRLKNEITPPPREKGHKVNCQCFICKRKRAVEEAATGTCQGCLTLLKRIRWNRECDIAACDDPCCRSYRMPQKVIAKDRPWREKAYGEV